MPLKAIGHNIIAKPIPIGEDRTVTTPDGNHEHYIEAISVGPDVAGVEEGDFILPVGDFVHLNTKDGKRYILTSSQVKATVDASDL